MKRKFKFWIRKWIVKWFYKKEIIRIKFENPNWFRVGDLLSCDNSYKEDSYVIYLGEDIYVTQSFFR